MPVSNQPIIDNINCKLTTGGLTDLQGVQLAAAADALRLASVCASFPCSECLPPANLNKGRFIHIANTNQHRYSDGASWTDYCISTLAQTNNFFTWGANDYGQLGDGTTTSRSSPGTTVTNALTWCSIAAGHNANYSAGIKTDGTLWTWGRNDYGNLGTGNTTSRSSPGTVAGAGTNWCQISLGYYTGAGIKTDGTLWTWGWNNCGALGDGTTTSRQSPGTTAGGGTNWCFVSAGVYTMAAIKTDGTLWTWGWNCGTFGNYSGGLGDGTSANRSSPGTTAGGGTTWCRVDASLYVNGTYMAGLKTDGTLWTWGYNASGQLGTGDTTSRQSPGTTAGGGTTWCQLSAKGYGSIGAIKTDGTLWTWGNGLCGVLGDGTVQAHSSPATTAGGGTTWCNIQMSYSGFAAGLKTDGTLWTWGRNSAGSLGTGNTTSRSSPGTVVGGFADWYRVSVGGPATAEFTLGLRCFVQKGF